jgi:hypothetical protein
MKKRILIIAAVVVVLAGVTAGFIYEHRKLNPPANAILVLRPYRHEGTWVFDDRDRGLVKEPFIAGMPEIIDKMVEDIPDAEKGFRLIFSASSFPDYEVKLVWTQKGEGGNWYHCEEYNMDGWLCPALYKYFRNAPKELYAKAEALQEH